MNGVTPGFGPSQVTWGDLAAWAALTGELLEAWEARTVVRLGALRASILSEEIEKQARSHGAHHKN